MTIYLTKKNNIRFFIKTNILYIKMSEVKCLVAPSILSCDFANLQSECERIIKLGADWLHIDIMDAHFVPNLTLGFPIIAALRKKVPKAFFDCHCMISEPELWVKELAKSGADQMTFHYESKISDIPALCKLIRENKMLVGISVKPKTPLDEGFFKLIDDGLIDLVLVMTVEPGFGGQKFMEDMMPKVSALRKKYPKLNIQVDGGISIDNVHISAKAGANVIVSGTGIYGHKDPEFAIREIRRIVTDNLPSH